MFDPTPEDRFTFGLWTVGNPGRDPFGAPVRETIAPTRIVEELARAGAYGVNLHDDDLVPFGSSAAVRVSSLFSATSGGLGYTVEERIEFDDPLRLWELSRGVHKEKKQEALRAVEESFMRRVLSESGGNLSKVARETGLNRAVIYDMLKRPDLDPASFRK